MSGGFMHSTGNDTERRASTPNCEPRVKPSAASGSSGSCASTVSGLGRLAAIAYAQPTASIPSRWRQTCWIRTLSPTSPIKSGWPISPTFRPARAGSTWAVILDLFTRKVVGWAMRDHMRAELTIAALTMAIQRQRPGAGLIHHSDRGSQYAAADYRDILSLISAGWR